MRKKSLPKATSGSTVFWAMRSSLTVVYPTKVLLPLLLGDFKQSTVQTLISSTHFIGYTTEETIGAICSGEILEPPKECNLRMYMLMRLCWRHEPEDRPSFKEVKLKIECVIEALDGNYDPSWTNYED